MKFGFDAAKNYTSPEEGLQNQSNRRWLTTMLLDVVGDLNRRKAIQPTVSFKRSSGV